jgi:hypothetical protein
MNKQNKIFSKTEYRILLLVILACIIAFSVMLNSTGIKERIISYEAKIPKNQTFTIDYIDENKNHSKSFLISYIKLAIDLGDLNNDKKKVILHVFEKQSLDKKEKTRSMQFTFSTVNKIGITPYMEKIIPFSKIWKGIEINPSIVLKEVNLVEIKEGYITLSFEMDKTKEVIIRYYTVILLYVIMALLLITFIVISFFAYLKK